MTDDLRSVAFDRAAEYYDTTRGAFDEVGTRLQTELLLGELSPSQPVLEVGIGTGQVALPLHDAGIDVMGLDLARPMMARLVAKSGGDRPFPLVQADATRMPFARGAFGAAYLRWVLHLIPEWQTALAEMVRVVRPEGAICILLGMYGGRRAEIQDRFSEITGVDHTPVGLGWNAAAELDRAMATLGRRFRSLPPIQQSSSETTEQFLQNIEANRYSWTWRLSDEVRMSTAQELRAWARDRFGRFDDPMPFEFPTEWRAYDSAPSRAPTNPA